MMCNLVASHLVNEITVHSTFVGKKKKVQWKCSCVVLFLFVVLCFRKKKKANKKPVPLNVEYKVILQIVLSIMAKFGLF